MHTDERRDDARPRRGPRLLAEGPAVVDQRADGKDRARGVLEPLHAVPGRQLSLLPDARLVLRPPPRAHLVPLRLEGAVEPLDLLPLEAPGFVAQESLS